jgi:hypothetical protein
VILIANKKSHKKVVEKIPDQMTIISRSTLFHGV